MERNPINRTLTPRYETVGGTVKPSRGPRVRVVARFRYVVCDVFTDTPLAGNQLAVFTDARGIPEESCSGSQAS